jgi:serine/threonine-protein kinase
LAVPLFLDNRKYGVHHIDETVISVSDNQYEIQDRIACGGNAVIHACIERATGTEYAIKFLLASGLKRIRRFKQEVKVIKHVNHEQLIKYIDDGFTTAEIKKEKKTKRIPFLVMPKAEQNLREFIVSAAHRISYEEYIAQFKGLTSALAALHQKAIHRDIKPENILIKGETWLLSDLGLCKFFDHDQQDLTQELEPIGPRYWMSPEAFNRMVGNNDEISKKSDVYQLCSIFWFVVTGRHPSGVLTKSDWSGPQNIFEPIFQSLSHNPDKRSPDANHLLELLNDATITRSKWKWGTLLAELTNLISSCRKI